MSRVLEFSDGAERGDTSWWTSMSGGVDTVNAIHGAYCYSIPERQGGQKTLTTPLDEFYFRCYLKPAAGGVCSVLFKSGSTALLTLTQDVVLARFNITGATTGNTGNNSITLGWQCLEIYYKISDTVGVVTVKLDGMQVFTFSGDTKPGSNSAIDNVYLTSEIFTQTFYADDFALDTAAWCGLGYYVGFTPNAAGDVTQWTPTGGANYANVGIPANDATFNTGTTGQTDNYAMTTTTLGSATVERVIPFVRASNPAGGTLNVGVLTEGVEHTSAVTTPTALTWLTGAEYINNPQTGNSWTQAQLDALQFVVDVP